MKDNAIDYKNIFLVDPVKGERIQLAKFLKHDQFTLMAFVAIADCFKKNRVLKTDLIVFVLRKGKSEIKHLLNLKQKFRAIPLIILVPPETPSDDVNMTQLEEAGFKNVHKAGNQEKVREIAYGLLAPEGLMLRAETPHPVPLT